MRPWDARTELVQVGGIDSASLWGLGADGTNVHGMNPPVYFPRVEVRRHAGGHQGDLSLFRHWIQDHTGVVRFYFLATLGDFDASPRRLRTLTRVAQLLETPGWVCARTAEGMVWCWTGDYDAIPRRVQGLGSVRDMALLDERACAAVEGALWCWETPPWSGGPLPWGLRRAVSAPRRAPRRAPLSPYRVAWPASVRRIVASPHRLCALETDGKVRCGALGADDLTVPTGLHEVTAVRGAVDLAARGDDGACALMPDGRLRCWNARLAAMPTGTWRYRERFGRVAALPPVERIAVAGDHACALTRAGEVYCWGANDRGQVDDSGVDRPTPVKVEWLSSVTRVAVGNGFSCALQSDDAVWCWGTTWTEPRRRGRVRIPHAPGAFDLVVSNVTLCVRSAGGRVNCQVAFSATLQQDDALGRAGALTPMAERVCAIEPGGSVVCSNPQYRWRETDRTAPGTAIALVESDSNELCVVEPSLRVACGTLYGVEPLWTTSHRDVVIAKTSSVARVLVSEGNVIMLRRDARVRLIGRVPDDPGLEGVTDIRAVGGLLCALHEDGTVSCAGRNDFGQLGDGSPSPDVPADAVFTAADHPVG